MPSYLILSLIIGEFFVFIAEMIMFPILIKEHGKSHCLSYAFIANLISLIAGGFIIFGLAGLDYHQSNLPSLGNCHH